MKSYREEILLGFGNVDLIAVIGSHLKSLLFDFLFSIRQRVR